ncbi:MAG: polyprenyl synthetase family protein [Candidatus Marinimicrobia bacterium]|nr:polyprenyl synthetase family protein [Candidatus Neomarinimicrobiota bacterium]
MDTQIKTKLNTWRAEVRKYLQHPDFPEEPGYLFEPMRYALNAEGKMLRPALCLAAAEAIGGQWQDAVIAGAALEIFHTFTLIHDDIMDGDELRRGIPTVHKAFDPDRALLAGDTLLIYVYQLLSRMDDDIFPKVFRVFNDGAMEVCLGQGWDMQFEKSAKIETHQYEIMIDLKTGALLKLACRLGGIIGRGSEADIEALSRFGLLLGRAFQMQDDLLEVTSSQEMMGKSLGSDVLNEKKTWIWQDLEKNFNQEQFSEWSLMRNSGQLSDDDREKLRTWMTEYGTIERAQGMINTWMNEANAILVGASFKDASMLKAMLTLILGRQN